VPEPPVPVEPPDPVLPPAELLPVPSLAPPLPVPSVGVPPVTVESEPRGEDALPPLSPRPEQPTRAATAPKETQKTDKRSWNERMAGRTARPAPNRPAAKSPTCGRRRLGTGSRSRHRCRARARGSRLVCAGYASIGPAGPRNARIGRWAQCLLTVRDRDGNEACSNARRGFFVTAGARVAPRARALSGLRLLGLQLDQRWYRGSHGRRPGWRRGERGGRCVRRLGWRRRWCVGWRRQQPGVQLRLGNLRFRGVLLLHQIPPASGDDATIRLSGAPDRLFVDVDVLRVRLWGGGRLPRHR
jgi:hypothetical protein